MFQPDGLKTHRPLAWTPGTGEEVWALFAAAASGDEATVTRLVDRTPPLVASEHDGRTALYFAVRENHVAVARALLDRGANPLHGDVGLDDRLSDIARRRGHHEIAALLDEHTARRIGPLARDDVVGRALRARDLATAWACLDAAPDLLHAAGDYGNQPIHWAVMTRQLDAIDALLARGADVNARRADGARPIQLCNGDYHYRGWQHVPKEITTTPTQVVDHLLARGADYLINIAALRGDLDQVRRLLDADPTLANRTHEYVTYYLGSGSPLRNAAARGHLEIVRLLLDRGADPNLPEPGIAPNGAGLYSAVCGGHLDVVTLLLERGAHPNPPMESSADALTMAAGNPEIRDLLCSYGAHRSVDILAYYGDVQTAAAMFAIDPTLADDPVALSNAAGEGHAAFVRLLLRHAPDLVARVSCGAGSRDLAAWLFAQGMSPTRRDWLGVTPLHRFAKRGDVDNAAVFLDHGAEIDAVDEDLLSTPLGWAARSGQLAMVEFLLSRGADPALPDSPAWASPLAWATHRGRADIARRLKL